MILQKEAFGARRVHHELMDALPEFGILFGLVHGADAAVQRPPAVPAVVGLVNARRRNGNVHPRFVRRVGRDGVQGETAVSGRPSGAVRMIEQAAHQRP